ncbi:hypothetical protein SDC9_32305 [bioreactor metagenome]|uniref:Uncharacterized protein n=1 Tax=bioreactor metagenome TaxID=1076179 RepID=A0A644V5L3_9ZZZZ
MRNEDICKRLNNRGIFDCWQLVASIWTYVASKWEKLDLSDDLLLLPLADGAEDKAVDQE